MPEIKSGLQKLMCCSTLKHIYYDIGMFIECGLKKRLGMGHRFFTFLICLNTAIGFIKVLFQKICQLF